MKYFLAIIMLSFTFGAEAQSKKNPIREFKIWANGQQLDADNLDVICVEEDFETFANFRWTLTDSTGQTLSQGFLKMTGTDYADYITKPNHGNAAVLFVMRELKLQRKQQAAAIQAARQAASGTTPKQ
jgi:BioD-like phosphotransacetylase family protein